MIENSASALRKKTDCEKIPSVEASKGFSLIELLVVIVIIGIIAAIGTPQLLSMRTKSSLRAEARDVHSAYRKAQTEAVKRSEDACLVLGENAGSYFYQIQIADYFGTITPGESSSLPTKWVRPGNSIHGTGALKDGTLAGRNPCFDFRGFPQSGVGVITLDNNRTNLTMEVELTLSGHVSSRNQ